MLKYSSFDSPSVVRSPHGLPSYSRNLIGLSVKGESGIVDSVSEMNADDRETTSKATDLSRLSNTSERFGASYMPSSFPSAIRKWRKVARRRFERGNRQPDT